MNLKHLDCLCGQVASVVEKVKKVEEVAVCHHLREILVVVEVEDLVLHLFLLRSLLQGFLLLHPLL
jgi:hypothetical protein